MHQDAIGAALPAGRGARTAAVMDAVQRRIAGRQLTAGARLPSVRALAQNMTVSPSTVAEAYGRLVADGVIEARRGSGFYVASALPALSLQDVGPRLAREVDPLWIARQSLQAEAGLLQPGCGWLPPDWMPHDSLRRALRAAARGSAAELADYASPQGLPVLRLLLTRRLGELAIEASPQQLLLTDSGTQALDLLCRLLLEPGAVVLVDDPCYFNFRNLLHAHRARVVAVPRTPNGPELAAFEQALRTHRPRLYLTNSALHNPTGATLSPAVAHRVLKLAEQYDLTIAEDGIFDDFEAEPTTRLAAFDGLARVVYVGSFSKTLSAAARCGYLAARPDWIEALTDLKLATCFGSSALQARLVLEMLRSGSYRRHVEALRERLARWRGPVARRLRALGIEPWIEPNGGLFLWCRLPDGGDATALAQAALSQGLVLAPGAVFGATPASRHYLRFNVAQCGDERMDEVLARLLRR